jgi:hypothetical protein
MKASKFEYKETAGNLPSADFIMQRKMKKKGSLCHSVLLLHSGPGQ